jgi:DNA-binding FadR family transcriptional regulator
MVDPVATNGAGSSIRLLPMEVPKASDVLANELRERILSGEYPDGTPLPPERELVTRTQMCRSTVREALALVRMRPCTSSRHVNAYAAAAIAVDERTAITVAERE